MGYLSRKSETNCIGYVPFHLQSPQSEALFDIFDDIPKGSLHEELWVNVGKIIQADISIIIDREL